MVRRKSGKSNWLQEYAFDGFVKQAVRQGYRSRAVYKLIEIDKRDRLFRSGMCVVDIGAAPGSWSQYAASRIGGTGHLIALDRVDMAPIHGVTIIRGDLTDLEVQNIVKNKLGDQPVDLVIADVAPNMSGIRVADEARAERLYDAVLDFADQVLRVDGKVLLKLFAGSGIDEVRRRFQERFARCVVRKPQASRSRSREFYLLALRYAGRSK